jgi:hypothetical protein
MLALRTFKGAPTPPGQSSARRRLPFQPPRWPSDISERIQSRSPSFPAHVQLQPPASLPNSAAALAIAREHAQGQSDAGSESFFTSSDRCLILDGRNVHDFTDALADRAGSQDAPRSPRIRFRQCDPPCSRSRAASTAKWGVSARTAQSARGGSSAVSASVVVAITNACAISNYMATLAAKKRASGAPPHLHQFASVTRATREIQTVSLPPSPAGAM